MINKLLNSVYGFALVGAVLFVMAWQFNAVFHIPAEGIDRFYAFAPLAIWSVMKARTMIR